ncbi:DNA cytosine methyltransferase [Burkholderia pyrrocinia]|uniref:DNA cytosine methyltransferase n=1 Tax=Burkholderia pyrrocinia TaxID=60550 RepID=UPI00158863AE|nr:DNA cytosine methyltransferase [Burkholderia pyrrocinia]
MNTFKRFIAARNRTAATERSFSFVSLFSGAGIGDYGLTLAGGECLAACELDPNRSAVHSSNIGAPIWGNIRTEKTSLIAAVRDRNLDLLLATPPCQSFSTANSRRGLLEDPEHATRDDRNHLFFEALEVARALRPKVVVFENVPNFLKRKIRSNDGKIVGRVEEFLRASLAEYAGWCDTLCFSDLDVPQRRKRSLAIFVRRDVLGDNPLELLTPKSWPGALTRKAKTIEKALNGIESLDGSSEEAATASRDFLHQVPVYSELHYRWISAIPSGSGQSAWENACENCGNKSTPLFKVVCANCGTNMYNRPHVPIPGGRIRPIKGFKTSYKRMPSGELAPTITTASGHFSSDLKLHPTENRVLSARECALLQTIPYSFQWPAAQRYKKGYLVREMIGEAVPPLVTYRLGLAVAHLISR